MKHLPHYQGNNNNYLFQLFVYSMTLNCGSFRETLGMKVVKALKRKDDAISHAAVDTLCALMQVSGYVICCHDIIFLVAADARQL